MLRTELIKNAWPELVPEETIGRGSFGYVYRVTKGEDELAVKVVSVPFEDDEEEVDIAKSLGMSVAESESFFQEIAKDYEREVRLMLEMKDNPNVVKVYDYRMLPKEDGVGFHFLYQMELLQPYVNYFGDHAPSEEESLRLGIDICSALEACEAHHILHRDIKPENIFVDAEGNFKLGDFGIARSLDNVTACYSRHGTANYMAPEVMQMKGYDKRADIYSLGLVLYRQMNGFRLPFISDRRLVSPTERSDALERRMRGETIPAPRFAEDKLGSVILKACEFEPEKRYQTATEMKEALLELSGKLKKTAIKQRKPKEKTKKTFNAWKLCIAALGLMTIGIVLALCLGKIGKHTNESGTSQAESESVSEHTFTDWKLDARRIGDDEEPFYESRFCTECGLSEKRIHQCEYSPWYPVSDGTSFRFCDVCGMMEFTGDSCSHRYLSYYTSYYTSWRGDTAKLLGDDSCLEKAFLCGCYYGCELCGKRVLFPHVFEAGVAGEISLDELEWKQASGGDYYEISSKCLMCGHTLNGDSFRKDMDGKYLSHLQHYVTGEYTLEGLSAVDAKKYHIITACSCGERDILEEHIMVDGVCMYCGYKQK